MPSDTGEPRAAALSPAPPPGYTFSRLDSPVPPALAVEISTFLSGFGPHFAATFGADYAKRLQGDGSTAAVVLYVARVAGAAGEADGELASHAAVLYDRANPCIGALFNVFTAEQHRRKGLSAPLVKAALAGFDAAGGKVCVLGTGSPHAAKVYGREGFERYAGSLDGDGPQGYNPGDACEFIMLRSTSPAPFSTEAHFEVPPETPCQVEEVTRAHFTDLALLFFANEGAGKLEALGINSGLLAEEPLTGLVMQIEKGSVRAVVAVVAGADGTRRVLGIRAERCGDPGSRGVYVYPGAAAARVAAALDAA
eukprot:m.10243 g.10243  ORF g.10243 m.10243 type:complete len:310 (-) comp4288_c0_seq1:113-1042(-)